ncbi:Fructokinase [Alloactinosynnema sp. L-07]|uniref:carbohydrate kinase family protein n=1 Tax=Alloactinosynnema sp. L-07 TaxID=1653480 RepID=UPI00065EFE6E|nr:carbohydrate kinase [Alloactinosynnema sp. L-07]CRK57463.1 Fructokinase [Alloactinosynnema sp. L-07]
MITVVGEALADLIAGPDGRTFTAHPGGSPANVALGLARLGELTRLATRLGEDLFGRMIGAHLTAGAVVVERLPAPTTDTSVAFAATDAAGVATYDFRIVWDITTIPGDLGRCVHTGSLATMVSPGAAVVEQMMADARADGVLVSLDPNVRPSLAGTRAAERVRIERQVAIADIVKVSDEDLGWLYPGADPADVAGRWLASGPRVVVVTRGGEGAYAVTSAGSVSRRAPAVTVIDTVGAGDAFTSGFLHWLSRTGLLDRPADLAHLTGDQLAPGLDLACAAAAITCSRPGADPPTSAELHAEHGYLL